MTPKLKPCPFCGSSAVHLEEATMACRLECLALACGAKGPWKPNYEAAIRAWNRRGKARAVIAGDEEQPK